MATDNTNREDVKTVPEKMLWEVEDLIQRMKEDIQSLEDNIMRRAKQIENIRQDQEVDETNLTRLRGAMAYMRSIETKHKVLTKQFLDQKRAEQQKVESEKTTPRKRRRTRNS